MGDTIKGDTVKTQGEGKRKEGGSNQTKREATREVMEPPLDQETIARLWRIIIGRRAAARM